MTNDELLSLIQGGESLSVEFKSDKGPLGDPEIFENIVCLANSEGGILIVGVENDGAITGLHEKHLPINPTLLQANIFNHTAPPINTRVNVHSFPQGTVLAIEVDKYPTICATSAGGCFRRVMATHGPECIPFYPYEHQSRRIMLGLEDLTARVVEGSNWTDLDPLEFERLRQTISRAGGDRRLLELSDTDLAKALRLVETQQNGELVPVIAGLLLVGREEAIRRYVPTHRVAFQAFEGSKILVNRTSSVPLLRQVEELDAAYEARKKEQEILVGMLRLPIPEYSKEAYREAINNALIHRDYAKLGVVYVQWHSDHLLITNPGGFPSGITPHNVLTHEPKPRNPRLAEICQRIGLVESSARGVDRIYLGQLRYGRPIPDYSRSDEEAVRLVLRGGTANLEFVRLVQGFSQSGQDLFLDELIALNQLHVERRLDVQTLSQLIQKGETDARKALGHLVELGLVEGRGQRSRSYFLSAKMYAKLGAPEGYVRVKGMEPIQQEAMVIEFIKAHGTITKAQTTELCQITSEQARVLLRKMVNDGKIGLVGSKRGAAYVLRTKKPLSSVKGKELLSIIADILKGHETLSLDEIDAALQQKGYEVAGSNKRNYLTGMMSRQKNLFERMERGRYRLIQS